MSRRLRTLVQTMAFASLLTSASCATIMTGAGSTQTLTVSSKPSGARVTVDGYEKGTTPIGVPVTRGDKHVVRIESEGHAAVEKRIEPAFNPWMLGNIIFGGIPGLVVDLLTGAHQSPNPSNVHVDFTRDDRKR